MNPIYVHKWLLLVHQLPPRPSSIRVKIWRRLQQLGAIAVKNAVYLLPNSSETREDFEWMRTQIVSLGGEATVLATDSIDAGSDDDLIKVFQKARKEDYAALFQDVQKTLRSVPKSGTLKGPRLLRLQRTERQQRERFSQLESIDFFSAPGRDRVREVLARVEGRLAKPVRFVVEAGNASSVLQVEAYQRRTWVTRPRPGIDRVGSAWLIRRYIDSHARFGFVESRENVPKGEVPFDMFGVEFSHDGDDCTFETLTRRFGIVSSSVTRLGQMVHNLDLKDDRFAVPEAATLGHIVDGLRQIYEQDAELLEHGIEVFEALHRALAKRQQGRREQSSRTRRGRLSRSRKS